MHAPDLTTLKQDLSALATARGFDALGVSDVALDADAAHLERWLAQGKHGEMEYMARHGTRRTRPDELIPGTVRVLSARMNYWPSEGPSEGPSEESGNARPAGDALADPEVGYVCLLYTSDAADE